MRGVALDRPFIEGVVLDQPNYKLNERQAEYAKDLLAPESIATQRHGWEYDGTTADVAANLIAVSRNKFLLAGVNRTITAAQAQLYIHNASGAGTALTVGGSLLTSFLPRAMHRDELLFCGKDGIDPLRRYAGAGIGAALSYTGTITMGTGDAATGGTLSLASDPGKGSYCSLQPATADFSVRTWNRVVESSTTSVTLENIRTGAGGGGFVAGGGTRFEGVGFAFPAVEVYSAGTVTYNDGTSTFTGTGTKWVDSSGTITTITQGPDGILLLEPDEDARFYQLNSVTNNTSLTASGGDGSTVTVKSPYKLMRRLPFKDVASHKGSLCGTGVKEFPNRVYFGPPGWDIALPPGYVPPHDPVANWSSPNGNDYLMDFIDIPAAFDGDDMIALLPSIDPLISLKRKDAWGVYGEFPNFARQMLPNGAGAGCADIRSAQSLASGQVWAGEEDVHVFTGSQVIGLTEGRINRLWRSMIADFDYGVSDYIATGETDGHLFVSFMTGGGTSHRTMVYDIQAQCWISIDFTNHKARYFNSSRVPGEKHKLLWVGDDDQGRVMNSTPVVDFTGLAKDGDGTSPALEAWTTADLDGTGDVNSETKVIDVAVSANITDAGASGDTEIEVSLVSGGGLTSQADSTRVLGTMPSDTVDRVDRKLFHPINKKGRLHQLRIETTQTGTNTSATKIEIPEISVTVEDLRSRT